MTDSLLISVTVPEDAEDGFTELVLVEADNENWFLYKQLWWIGTFKGKRMSICVPKGYKTNLASIPKIFRPLFPVNGRHRKAAVFHDYHCDKPGYPRLQADELFYEHMKELGVPRWRAKLMYAAVRVGAYLSDKT